MIEKWKSKNAFTQPKKLNSNKPDTAERCHMFQYDIAFMK